VGALPTRAIHVWAPAFRPFGGGIAAFSRELAGALASLGHRLALFGRDDRDQDWDGARLRGAGARPLGARRLARGPSISSRTAAGSDRRRGGGRGRTGCARTGSRP
jgi:hypothetical protein